jgi:tryptophanyl-tRNA synthetase
LAELSIGSLDDPAAFVTSQLAAILAAPLFVVVPVGRDQIDAAFLQLFARRVGGAVGRMSGP